MLEYLYSLTGKYIFAGQHNYPAPGDRNTQFASDYMGKTPPVWSQDFGFSAEWKLNECESSLNGAGLNSIQYKLSLVQNDNELKIKSTTIVEYDDDEIR